MFKSLLCLSVISLFSLNSFASESNDKIKIINSNPYTSYTKQFETQEVDYLQGLLNNFADQITLIQVQSLSNPLINTKYSILTNEEKEKNNQWSGDVQVNSSIQFYINRPVAQTQVNISRDRYFGQWWTNLYLNEDTITFDRPIFSEEGNETLFFSNLYSGRKVYNLMGNDIELYVNYGLLFSNSNQKANLVKEFGDKKIDDLRSMVLTSEESFEQIFTHPTDILDSLSEFSNLSKVDHDKMYDSFNKKYGTKFLNLCIQGVNCNEKLSFTLTIRDSLPSKLKYNFNNISVTNKPVTFEVGVGHNPETRRSSNNLSQLYTGNLVASCVAKQKDEIANALLTKEIHQLLYPTVKHNPKRFPIVARSVLQLNIDNDQLDLSNDITIELPSKFTFNEGPRVVVKHHFNPKQGCKNIPSADIKKYIKGKALSLRNL